MINNLMIFGDSYSTFKGLIPQGYVFYYCEGGISPDQPVTNMKYEDTWWGRFIEKTGANLVRNDSWSGSTIGYTGYSGDCSHTSSFICRHRKLMDEGFFEKNQVDTIIIFGGTNDYWCSAPLGEKMWENWQESDLFNVLPAVCHFILSLRENHPDARLIVVANSNIKAEIVQCFEEAAERVEGEFVRLSNIDKSSGHPTPLGMEQICDQILEHIEI